MANEKIVEFYDEYSKKQINTGINIRHYQLFKKIIKAGLKKNFTVLEVGCGIGTLTSLILSYLKNGRLVAADISGKSIDIAKKRFANNTKVDFLVSDMMDFSNPQKFDMIILPDVLEHIPIENHLKLFEVLSNHMHDNSQIVINIPHPKIIEYYESHSPEVLQIVDQSIWPDTLIKNTSSNQLILKQYNPYSIHHKEEDYAFVVFGKKTKYTKINNLSTINIIRRKFIYRLFYLWNKV